MIYLSVAVDSIANLVIQIKRFFFVNKKSSQEIKWNV